MSSETSGLLHWPFVLWQAQASHQHVRFLGEVLVARPAGVGAELSSLCDAPTSPWVSRHLFLDRIWVTASEVKRRPRNDCASQLSS